MNKKEIISKVLSDENSFSVQSAEELETLLDKEFSKRDNEIDYELVNELTLAAIEARGDKPIENNVREKLKEFNVIKSRKKKRFRLPKWSVGLAAACVMLMCTNVISVSAWNMNIFSLIVELTKGGVKIDFGSEKEEIIIPTFENDPYGIIAKCNEQGIYTETPHYIPDGFILTNIGYDANNDQRKYIAMIYEKDNQLINFTFESCMDGLVGIPSDEHNLSEITVNGHTAIMSREDNQMIVIFRSEDFYVTICTKNVDYTECDYILNSIK